MFFKVASRDTITGASALKLLHLQEINEPQTMFSTL